MSASSITLVGRDGKSQTVNVDAKTKVFAGRAEAKAGDVKSGWLAFVETGSNGVATAIRAVDPAQIREHAGHPCVRPGARRRRQDHRRVRRVDHAGRP